MLYKEYIHNTYPSGEATVGMVIFTSVHSSVAAGDARTVSSGGKIIDPLIISKYGGALLLLKRVKANIIVN